MGGRALFAGANQDGFFARFLAFRFGVTGFGGVLSNLPRIASNAPFSTVSAAVLLLGI